MITTDASPDPGGPMTFDRRTWALLALVGALLVPAGLLRVLCVGEICEEPAGATSSGPFCSLPPDLRALISAGFHEDRSPDVVAVSGGTDVRDVPPRAGTAPVSPAWPRVQPPTDDRVPLAFVDAGLDEVPAGTGLDDVSLTGAALLGFSRPHPEVRSGRAVTGTREGARVLVHVVWKGVGSSDLERDPSAWPNLDRLIDEHGGTLDARTESVPLDPTAVLATIGTGGIPRQHGIVGGRLRTEEGALVSAAAPGAPVSVISTLADDLDERTDQRSTIALVGTAPTDRVVIGGKWYVDVDRDEIDIAAGDPDDQVRRAEELIANADLRDRWSDAVPDLVYVVMRGNVRALDRALPKLVAAARRHLPDVSLIVTGTGSARPDPSESSVDITRVVKQVESAVGRDGVVEAATAPGFFLDQAVLARHRIPADDVVDAIGKVEGPRGDNLFSDVFSAISVSFARYC